MESWIQRFVLAAALTGALAFTAPTLHAAEDELGDDRAILDEVVSPDLERRVIQEDKLDSENIEIGMYAGIIAIEDFGSSDVYGAQLDLHITEDIFIEASAGIATLQKTSYELLSGDILLLTDKQRDMTYYGLAIGVNLFPGQMYLGGYTFNNSFYVLGGAGNTDFAGNEYLTYQFGAGFRMYFSDWMALHVGFKNYVLTHDIFAYDKKIQNLEGIVGLTLFL